MSKRSPELARDVECQSNRTRGQLMIGLLAALLLFGVAASYWLLANRWLRQWVSEGEDRRSPCEPLPPITFLRPLKRDTPRLEATLEKLVNAMRPDDQLLLGLES